MEKLNEVVFLYILPENCASGCRSVIMSIDLEVDMSADRQKGK